MLFNLFVFSSEPHGSNDLELKLEKIFFLSVILKTDLVASKTFTANSRFPSSERFNEGLKANDSLYLIFSNY